MSVIERTRDIGVLRALGSSRRQVRSAMVDESLLITLSGAAAGIAFGAVIGFLWIQGLGSLLPGISFHFPAAATAIVAGAAVPLWGSATAPPAPPVAPPPSR